MMQVFHKLQEAWILKVCLSCAVTVAIHEHAQIFTAFVALVFVDLFSKWLSLSRQRLVDHGEQSPNLWKVLTSAATPCARALCIRSWAMSSS